VFSSTSLTVPPNRGSERFVEEDKDRLGLAKERVNGESGGMVAFQKAIATRG
jgi:hypothetical protein